MPTLGLFAAASREEPVSLFDKTDDEREMRDRAWSIVRPPHTRDWIVGTIVEAQRTRLIPEVDEKLDPKRYFHFLATDRFRSSTARWSRMIDDIRADRKLVQPFFAVVARVRAADEERMLSVKRLTDIDEGEAAGAYARVEENQRVVAWVCRAIDYRIRSYDFAIERLAIETPSPLRAEARFAWKELIAASPCEANGAAFVEYAEAPPPVRPSRYGRPPASDLEPGLPRK